MGEEGSIFPKMLKIWKLINLQHGSKENPYFAAKNPEVLQKSLALLHMY